MIAAVGPGKVDDAGRVAGLGAAGVVARPGLFGRLGGPARVTVVAAPAGSGKTVLLRSWIAQAGLSGRAAWVPVGREERDPQHFWLSVLAALRATAAGAALVRELTAAPDLDGWLGLHRLRLEGELAEIRTDDLRFSLAEAAELFAAAGVELPAATVAVLHERTEGWAAGLRLAALSLAGHSDPGRFAAEF